ncbi:hypothetical protein Avbf_11558 [Armadillidium vulgare]|nr:hypothetical protein Avbf_11558 [Armadillidium vulgare]
MMSEILLTIYFILKVYVSSVVRPDQVKEKKDWNDYNNYEVYNPNDFILDRNTNAGKSPNDDRVLERVLLKEQKLETITIWGKAAISSYFWEHIIGGTRNVDEFDPSIYSSEVTTSRCHFLYKEGPGLSIMRKPSIESGILVLILNGRTKEKVSESQEWINYVKRLPNSPKVIVIMLGNENCNNGWIDDYLFPNGPIYGVFLTYDDPSIDEKVKFQWPLGVATYRHFPLFNLNETAIMQSRKFLCNLQATNYANSSRSELFSVLKSSETAQKHCKIEERKQWQSHETPESSTAYTGILLHSDLTLCPAGINTETYRVYEALAAGSIPVVEDTPSKGSCDKAIGWRLLKEMKAPVIWTEDWNDLDRLLRRESQMKLKEKVSSRSRRKVSVPYKVDTNRNSEFICRTACCITTLISLTDNVWKVHRRHIQIL